MFTLLNSLQSIQLVYFFETRLNHIHMCVCHTTLSFHNNIAFFDNEVSVVEVTAI